MRKKYIITKHEQGKTLYYSSEWIEDWDGYKYFWAEEFDWRLSVNFIKKANAKNCINIMETDLRSPAYYEIKKVYY